MLCCAFLTRAPHLLWLTRQVTSKSFKFAEKNNLPFFFVSASDGTNVVKIFQTAILEGEAAQPGVPAAAGTKR
jgi:hypothetical protein